MTRYHHTAYEKERYISHSFIRFRQWSRKAYAIFATLGLCVTIGQLRKNITECALCKQQTPHTTGLDPQRENRRFRSGRRLGEPHVISRTIALASYSTPIIQIFLCRCRTVNCCDIRLIHYT